MEQQTQYLREAQIFLFLQWVFFNALGWAIGLLLIIGAEPGIKAWHLYGVISLGLGLGQWIVLRRYLRRPSIAWIGATIIGFMLGQIAAQQVTTLIIGDGSFIQSVGGGLVFGGLIGAILGLLLGLVQMLLFAKNVVEKRYWVLANAVGWGLGFQASSLMGQSAFQISSLVAAILCSIVTGFVVMRLLNDD